MPEQLTITLYSFDELSDEARDVAVEKMREQMSLWDHLEGWFTDYCEEEIKNTGFEGSVKLGYAIENGQGSGLRFECDQVSEKLMKEILSKHMKSANRVEWFISSFSISIKGGHRRVPYASDGDIELEYEERYTTLPDNVEELVEEVQDELNEIYMNLCSRLYQVGSKAILDGHSSESAVEYLSDSDNMFYENGARYL